MWGRATAAIVPGFLLAAALVGLVSWCWPGPWQDTIVSGALVFFPLWMGIAAASFQFSHGVRAWIWLGAAATGGLTLLWALRTAQWVV